MPLSTREDTTNEMPPSTRVDTINEMPPSISASTTQHIKKSLGVEWEFATNLENGYIHWQCNLCKCKKSGGAPQIREHFLDSLSKSICKYTHPMAVNASLRIREYYQSKNHGMGARLAVSELE